MKIGKISAMVIATVMALSFVTLPASAANIKDEDYSIYSTSGTYAGGGGRYKENNSKVYVYAISAPGTARTNMRTYCYVSGVSTNKTNAGTVTLESGYKYAITNWVYEHGDYTTGYGVRMWLAASPTSGSGTMTGKWSPDWSGTGSGIIIV